MLAYNLKRMMSIFGIAGLLEAIRARGQALFVRNASAAWIIPGLASQIDHITKMMILV